MPKKPAPKPKAAPKTIAQYYNAASKPDPNGLYDRDGFQVRFDKDVKKDSFTKQPQARTDTDAAKRAGYAK